MKIPRGRLFVTERILRPIKKPVWYVVHAVSGIRMQMPTHYFDASMVNASFRVPIEKVKGLLPCPELVPLECAPEFAEILIAANEFRHMDILYPYNEVDRHPFEVPERDMHEPAGIIKAAFHHDGVPVWIKPNKRTAGLIGQNHACVNRPIGRLGIEPFDHGEKESVDIGEQAAVVPKVWA